ncbi:MAG: hypothetical protein H0X17_01160 [Deltaproteobacteria bacterium]|nr:hypothetical protein [Deltaproteobacteria bacterium]
MMSSSASSAPANVSLAPRMADHPRFLESVVGRLLDLMVYSVEGIRSKLQRPSVH